MIKYNIKCGNDHVFESWFNNSTKCDEMMKENLVECPVCGDTDCSKALMAPNIPKKGGRPKSDYSQTSDDRAEAIDWVEKNCDDVGENFANEVRAIHYGDKEGRNIYGTTTKNEAHELRNEGIDVINLGTARSKKQEH